MSDPSYGNGRARPRDPMSETRRMPADSQYHQPYDSQPYEEPRRTREREPSRVSAGRIWAGGAGSAVVAALMIIVSILLLRGVFGIPVLAPEGEGAYGSAETTTYALAAALIALVATGVLHLLLMAMPNPMTFFYWIGALLLAVAVILPFTFAADDLPAQIATAGINLLAGICLLSVLGSVGTASVRESARREREREVGRGRRGYGY